MTIYVFQNNVHYYKFPVVKDNKNNEVIPCLKTKLANKIGVILYWFNHNREVDIQWAKALDKMILENYSEYSLTIH